MKYEVNSMERSSSMTSQSNRRASSHFLFISHLMSAMLLAFVLAVILLSLLSLSSCGPLKWNYRSKTTTEVRSVKVDSLFVKNLPNATQ